MSQQQDKRAVFRGKWYRCSEYVIRDGYIRPASKSTLCEYDPWAVYYQERLTKKRGVALWQPLCEIGREVERLHAQQGMGSDEKLHQMVLAFCREYGLLGILLHQVHQVVFEPRWEHVSEQLANHWQQQEGMTEDEANKHRYITVRYRRDPKEGWAIQRHILSAADEQVEVDPSWQRGVLLQPAIDQADLAFEDIRKTFAEYFPGVSKAEWIVYRPPLPTDWKFWNCYAEPLSRFLEVAYCVYDLSRGLSQSATKPSEERYMWLYRLSTVTGSLRPMFFFGEGGEIRQGWESPSLLGIVVMMLGADVAGHFQLLSCGHCGCMFTSKSYQAEYCTRQCKNAARKKEAKKSPPKSSKKNVKKRPKKIAQAA